MNCLLCELGEGEKEWHKFCPDCIDEKSVDVYSQPLQDASYHVLMLWGILKKKRLSETLTEEERELVGNSLKFQEIVVNLLKENTK